MHDAASELTRLVPALLGLPSVPHGLQFGDEDCAPLLHKIVECAKEGAHVAITRKAIIEGISCLPTTTTEHLDLSNDDFALLSRVFLVVDDYFGLQQVRVSNDIRT